ncbi:MAG: glycosyl transferase family 1, partial [Rhodospirillaceae bacterium]|nr:glycosyl transferase family 1 [Rhodospirillaceae bacterium]
MSDGKTIAFFPEGAFGPALNSVGIAQVCREMGHNPVFIADAGFGGVFEGYGFEEHLISMSEPMEPEAMARYWVDFINGQIPNFRTPPLDQVSTYIKACWEAIVDTALWAEKDLPATLDKIKPDLICVDNVVLFPATKQYGVPWVRIISCSENEIEDPDIPPHLSGCREDDPAGFAAYREKFDREIGPIHAQFNEFLKDCGEEPYPLGQFFEASPWLNLLHYPKPLAFNRRHALDTEKIVYLEGCIRKEEPYEVPQFKAHNDKPLLYVSFGSLGSG